MITVVYHANCQDGFGAAYAAWKKLGDSARYLPIQYGEPLPQIDSGSDLYILDFSFPREELVAAAATAGKLLLLDHHATAFRKIADLPFVQLDLGRSGAWLAWQYFHPDTPIPMFIQRLDDRDRGVMALPGTRYQYASLETYPRNFPVWDALANDEARLLEEGRLYRRRDRRYIKDAIRQAQPIQLRDTGGESHAGLAVNSGDLQTDISIRLLRCRPDIEFVAVYQLQADAGKVRWSLRSRKGGFDVSLVAELLGGGGHAEAAGFNESFESFAQSWPQRFGTAVPSAPLTHQNPQALTSR